MKRFVIAVTGLLLLSLTAQGQAPVSETRYDWSELSRKIAGNTTDKHEQAYRIYRWLCDNIAYDTSYSIYHSDECFDNRRGVCQAYSELFYRLAEPLGLKVDIVSGKAKDLHGGIDAMGHAWVFVYMTENSGFLVDPTWGAGSVDGKVFTRNKSDDSWFDVDPYWMIFSHIPDPEMETYQLLPEKIDFETFKRLPSYRPAYAAFGQNAQELLRKCLSGGKPDVPTYYPQMLAIADVNNMPLTGTLRVGQYYDFALRQKTPAEFMIHNGDRYYKSADWQKIQGHDVCRFMPSEAGKLTVSIKTGSGDTWSVLAEYTVAKPTADDIARLEAAEPEHSPALTGLKNFREENLRAHNVDMARLLKTVKAQRIKSLPMVHTGTKFAINDIPWSGVLRAGETYTFRIAPYEGSRWAVINGDDWYMEWAEDSAARGWTITVTPKQRGPLYISVESEQNRFLTCIEYEVE